MYLLWPQADFAEPETGGEGAQRVVFPIARGHVGKASDSQMLAMHGAGAEAARWTGRDGWTTAGVMFHLVMQIADV